MPTSDSAKFKKHEAKAAHHTSRLPLKVVATITTTTKKAEDLKTPEEVRRRHVEEMRERENAKRQNVEERRRAIMTAEKERREKILLKSLERGTKSTDAKKRDSNSTGFAFGSSTPRLLNATDNATKTSTPAARRRASSISNGDTANYAQRIAERELANGQVKKRANSTCVADMRPSSNKTALNSSFHSATTSTPKRSTGVMSSSLIVTNSRSAGFGFSSSTKHEQQSASTPKRLSMSTSFSRIPKSISNMASTMTKSAIAACTVTSKAATPATKAKKASTPHKSSNNDNSLDLSNSTLMSASFIARNKITTEEEAIAALAERRRHKRAEAERHAALVAQQKLEDELRVQTENQRKYLEESIRLAEEQQRAAEAELRQAMLEEKLREHNERQRLERQILARVEAENRANKKEAEMLKKLEEAAARLRLEEQERNERRRRVEEIMSRMRKAVDSETNATSATTSATKNEQHQQQQAQQANHQQQQPQSPSQQSSNDVNSHAKYNVNSTGILIVRESNFNFLRS